MGLVGATASASAVYKKPWVESYWCYLVLPLVLTLITGNPGIETSWTCLVLLMVVSLALALIWEILGWRPIVVAWCYL